jgi:diguanylate cyclase (GGDEF)-like protein
VVDVDAFKLLNDEQGHAAGDEALQALAASLRGALAAGDIAGRLGGEEFGALVVDVDDEGALAVADRIRAAVEDSGVTVSVGVAARRPEETLDALLRRADMAMYRAKRRGGNAATLG